MIELKIVFVSNYFNHHQKPFCDAMAVLDEHEFYFIATIQMRAERKKLGYGMLDVPAYVKYSYASEEDFQECMSLINDADVVIAGSVTQDYLKQRISDNKLIFRYSERPLKNGFEPLKYIPRYIRWHKRNPQKKNIYLLCASAYTACDYAKFGLFKNRAYKWGYFPETRQYVSLDELLTKKRTNQILWCGRYLDWKHPDDVIRVAKRLKAEGYDFTLDFIGTGAMENILAEMIAAENLSDRVHLLGSMSPESVREHMEKAGIYLFTSDKQEGWGAVLNEAMNSGCAVVAGHEIGSVPFLMKDEENGLMYTSGDVDMLYEKVKYLLEHPDEQRRLGCAAYHTIVNEWNAEVAADRLVDLTLRINKEKDTPNMYKSGPCSKALILNDKWCVML